MICIETVKRICKEYSKVENYDKAFNDTTQTWVLHHRLEEFVSRQWLIEHNDYYNVSPNELIFLTKSEHTILHNHLKWGSDLRDKMSKNISKSLIGRAPSPGFSGKKHSDKTKEKMSQTRKGRNISEDTKKKISEVKKNKHKHWYNNGIINILSENKPEGFVPGFIKRR